jgi:hypothetical protein
VLEGRIGVQARRVARPGGQWVHRRGMLGRVRLASNGGGPGCKAWPSSMWWPLQVTEHEPCYLGRTTVMISDRFGVGGRLSRICPSRSRFPVAHATSKFSLTATAATSNSSPIPSFSDPT